MKYAVLQLNISPTIAATTAPKSPMLATMVVAVRQALDYTGTGRAIAVCVIGWVIALGIALITAFFLGVTVFALVFGLLARFAPTEARDGRLHLRPYAVGLLARGRQET